MDINIHNYEAYVIDFLEGTLSADLEEEMRLFLLQNPDIEAEIMGLEEVVLEADESVVFEGKEILLQFEEEKKVIALSLQWRKWAMPIAAALCLFLVWQGLLKSSFEENENGLSEVATVIEEGEKEDQKEESENVALFEEKGKTEDVLRNLENEKNIQSEKETTLKLKVKKSKSLLVDNSVSPDKVMKPSSPSAAKRIQTNQTDIEVKKKASVEVNKLVKEEVFGKRNRIDIEGFDRENRREGNGLGKGEIAGVKEDKVEDKERFEEKEKEGRSRVVVAKLPTNNRELVIEEANEKTEESLIAAVDTDIDFREIPQVDAPVTNANMERERKKPTRSTFLNNLKRAITPEVFAKEELYESSRDSESEVLVSISLKPAQHNFIKKIFKNNR